MAVLNDQVSALKYAQGTAKISDQLQNTVNHFKYICEAISGEPVDVSTDYMRHTMRVMFRYSNYNVETRIIDLEQARNIEDMARYIVEVMKKHTHKRESDALKDAYDRQNQMHNAKSAGELDNVIKKQMHERIKNQPDNSLKIPPPKGTLENPLRIDLQKRVDKWLDK